MSTDTALALGLLALLGREVPDRVRVFLLTVSSSTTWPPWS